MTIHIHMRRIIAHVRKYERSPRKLGLRASVGSRAAVIMLNGFRRARQQDPLKLSYAKRLETFPDVKVQVIADRGA